ncbi:hypothetical protein CRD36_10255 [Paremcibacter congregatus]|uniref:FAD dependent oxidoreductase domain-containing protein n=2 Tax=Paremcibacter congregatus TaxID=2043170 RepID=A0A2G4YQQ8_9PROT|nr:hypothetical protein CRD36_10255 [Paremcibacter congregatus]
MSGLQLLERGVAVTFIDRHEPGDREQTSYGNAGSISIGNMMPMGKPGFIKEGAGMLIDPLAPLMLPIQYWHRSVPWVAKVCATSSERNALATAHAIGDLNLVSAAAWRKTVADLKLGDLVQATGWLKLYESEASFAKTRLEQQLMTELGIAYEVLDREQICDREPDIAPVFYGGLCQTESLAITNPGKLMKRLCAAALSRGAIFKKADVLAIERQADGYRLELTGGPHECATVLLSAGAWSQRLLEPLGYHIPLETERGYHLMFDSAASLSGPVINMDRYIALCPMGPNIRMTSCVELAGLDQPADYNRITKLAGVAQNFLPKLGNDVTDRWMGYRPSLPDSRPVIGKASRDPGLFLAFGNGHLGMTQGAGTGQLIAELICTGKTSLDLQAYSPVRFNA